jgi:hypothetical protein
MTIPWATIKSDVADALATALAQVQSEAFAAFPIPSIPISATYTWDGTNTILTSDTSEVNVYDPGDPPPGGTTPTTPASYIRLDSDGNWYKVIGIVTDTSITVEDTYNIGSFPTGSTASSKSDGPVPSPPSVDTMKEKLATPIAESVFDGVKDALDTAEIHDVADDLGNVVGPGVII